MADKIKDLLAVLSLRDEPETPEEIQFQWTPLKAWVSKNLFDDPDERNAFYKGYISLADLAFRLRDKAFRSAKGKAAWCQGCRIVIKAVNNSDEFPVWSQPIHWIIAALIAKELKGEK